MNARFRPAKRKWLLIMMTAAILIFVNINHSASAHAADQYLHELEITFAPNTIDLTWNLTPGTFLSSCLWHETDTNDNNLIEPQEGNAFCSALLNELSMQIDQQALPKADLIDCRWPQDQDSLLLGNEGILLTAVIPLAEPPQDSFAFQIGQTFEQDVSLTLYHLQSPAGTQFVDMQQKLNTLNGQIRPSPASQPAELATWNSEQPDLSVFNDNTDLRDSSNRSVRQRLTALLRSARDPLSSASLFSMLFIPFTLGMLHAFTPGHGKSVVAAYMIGSRGNWLQGLFLGGVVSFTHTSIVILSGLVLLFGADLIMAENIYPFFESLSALLILILGLWLLFTRWRAVNAQTTNLQKVSRIIHKDEHTRQVMIQQPITEAGPPHPTIGPKYNPTHKANLQKLEWRTLLALGTSGGLVPCPDAIAIFLIAASLNMLKLGITMIAAFSAGIALVLMILGYLIAVGKGSLEKLKGMQRFITLAPLISAFILILLGGLLFSSAVQKFDTQTINVAIAILKPQFDPDKTAIAFIDINENDQAHLFVLQPGSQNPQQITQGSKHVSAFVRSPQKNELFYIDQDRSQNKAQLWKINIKNQEETLLLSLANASIHTLWLSPDNTWLLFDRYDTAPSDVYVPSNSIWGYHIK